MDDIYTQVFTIIDRQPKPVAEALCDLQTYFYQAAGPVERYEYETGVTPEIVMAPIQDNLKTLEHEFLLQSFAGSADSIRNAASAVFSAIIHERIIGGRVSGNAHHIRQRMCAEAIIAVAEKLELAK